jgi:hypothetical protein
MKKIPESWDPQEPDTFSECTFRFLVLRTSMQSDSTCFFQAFANRSSQLPAGENFETLYKPIRSTKKWNSVNQKNISESWGPQESGTFFRFAIWIPILSVPPNWLAKRIDMLHPGNPTQILTAPLAGKCRESWTSSFFLSNFQFSLWIVR